MKRLLLIFSFILSMAGANEAEDIIKKVEKNMRGDNAHMRLTMTISTSRHERNLQMESWAVGNDKSFIKILSPARDRGITFLKLDNKMWQYVPKIERTIKIPPSMMLQSWMGSDFTNDDLMRESSMVEDYSAQVIHREGSIVTIELKPLENASVVWGKILSKVDTTKYTQIEDRFYDDDGGLVRVFSYDTVKKFGRYYVPTLWRIKPMEEGKKDHETVIRLDYVAFDKGVDPKYFTKKALIRYSR